MTATPILMPKLGMTMEEGSVVEWRARPGEAVAKGGVLLVIETEKTEAEIEATVAGVLRHVYVAAGSEPVPCGTLLAALTGDADEPFDAEAFAAERPPAPRAAEAPAPPASVRTAPARPGSGRPVAPAARVAAKKLGVALGAVPGTGPGGRVTKQDVEAFAAAREKLVPVAEGVALEVLREGQGEPVLLLPGFGTDVSAFARQTGVLAERFAVLGLNPRGVGHSDAPEADLYEIATAAADAAAVLERPAHVVGASLGAAIALELALARPDLVRSLTLLTPFVEASPRLRAVMAAWVQLAEEASPETVARSLAPWLFSGTLLSDDAVRERTLRGLAATVRRIPAAVLRRYAAGIAAWSGTRNADLGSVTVPTLVLVAGEDLLTPDGEALAAAIPKARIEVVARAGHALAIEAADAVNAALLRALAEA